MKTTENSKVNEAGPTVPILFFINRKALRDLESNINYGKQHLQQILNEYQKVAGSAPTLTELSAFFGSSRSNYLVADKELIRESILMKLYLQQKAKYPTLMFSSENIVLPDMEPLFEACSQLLYIPEIFMKEEMLWGCYQIQGDQVEIIPEAIEAVKNRFRSYAITNEERTRLATIQRLIAVINTIKLGNPSVMNIPGFTIYDDESGTFVPQENFIKCFIN